MVRFFMLERELGRGVCFPNGSAALGAKRRGQPGKLVTFLVLPRKVTKRRRPRCAAAHADPGPGTRERGLRNSPWRGIHPMPRCGARTMLAQTPARRHPICGTAHRGRGGQQFRATERLNPCAPRAAQAGQEFSDAYVRARGRAADRASLRGGLGCRAAQGSRRLAHRGVLSLVPFFAQAKKGTCCRLRVLLGLKPHTTTAYPLRVQPRR
jgi:hypothetical protein